LSELSSQKQGCFFNSGYKKFGELFQKEHLHNKNKRFPNLFLVGKRQNVGGEKTLVSSSLFAIDEINEASAGHRERRCI
jgi:hypothetical protein